MTIKIIPLMLLPLTLCLSGCDFLSSAISESWHTYRNDADPFSPPQENKAIAVEGMHTACGAKLIASQKAFLA
jgi:hypothetical protein